MKLVRSFACMLTVLVMAVGCSSDDEDNGAPQTYNTKVSITDAPIDNANVSAVFVTVADVKVNGVSLEGFSRTTVDLMQLQNGNTQLLGDIDLQSGAYSNVSLVLDYTTDANGASPGCYVLTTDDVKHALEASSNEIQISDSFEIAQSASNNIVIDFDLRKTIVEQNDPNDQFDFATTTELSNSLRIVNELNAGTMQGQVTDAQATSEVIVVYAYAQGTFDAATETSGQGASNVLFANAVTSAAVEGGNGSYSLNFLKEGTYELHFASYNDDDNDGQLEFSSMLEAESVSSLNLAGLEVQANLQLSVNVLITGTIN